MGADDENGEKEHWLKTSDGWDQGREEAEKYLSKAPSRWYS